MDSLYSLLTIGAGGVLCAAAAFAAGAIWARRGARVELAETVRRVRGERDETISRCESQMKMEVAALEARMLEDRKRTAREFAAVESRRQREIARWRQIALVPAATAQLRADYADRPSPRDLEAIVARLRGFAFLDAVAIADSSGLLLCADESATSRDLATLGAVAAALRDRLPGGERALPMPASPTVSVSLSLILDDARHLVLRPLPPWTDGAWLIAASLGQPPSPLALDAAVGLAYLREEALPPRQPLTGALRGSGAIFGDSSFYGQRLLAEMEALLGLSGARAVAVSHKGELLAAITQGGPSPEECEQICLALDQVRRQAAWHLHAGDTMRVDLVLEEGLALTYAPLQASSEIGVLMVDEGHQPGGGHLQALIGRVRRILADQPQAPPWQPGTLTEREVRA
jgi:hypothetical protein